MWRILELLKSAEAQLREAGIESPRQDAEWLLAAVLKTNRAGLYMQRDRPLQADQQATFDEFLSRRRQREPLQYILGVGEFYGFELIVTPVVLIPRPETELLVEKVVELASTFPSPRIIDLGTGSGCIAISLAKLLATAHLVATDISEAALEVARENAERYGMASRIEFRRADMTKPQQLSQNEVFDIVVSNPPYVLETERSSILPEIREWEPREALFVEDDGLKFYRAILSFCRQCLRTGG
jgi:release factor glutamine methyltransferase